MTETSPTTPNNEVDAARPLQAPLVPTMSPETRGALRRRLLLGGAATVPAIVTFGRPRMAQSFVLSNCLARAFELNDIPMVGEATRADLIALAQGLIAPEPNKVDIGGEIYLVNNAPGDANAERMDALILSAGVSFDVVPVFDANNTQVMVEDQPLFSLIVVSSSTTQAGCIASAGITILADA